MPRFTTPDGRTVSVPGVYLDTEVISSLPGPIPAFHIPVIVADVDRGWPADFDTSADRLSNEPDRGAFTFVGNVNEARRLAGHSSDADKAVTFAIRHGLPFCYLVTATPLTRAKVLATSGVGTVNQIQLAAATYGPWGGWIKLQAPSGTSLEILPPRQHTLLTEDVASGDTRLYVKDNSWARVGQTVSLGDNSSSLVEKEVARVGEELDSNGQVRRYIDLTTTAGAAYTVALFGALAEYDEQDRLVSGALSGDALIEWINDNAFDVLLAERGAGYTGVALDALATDTALKEIAAWDTPQVGTAPAPSTANHTTLIGAIQATYFVGFLQQYQLVPRSWLVATPDATNHASWRDFEIERRTAGLAVSITTGVGWGDTVLDAGDSTDPLFRTAALVGPGIDREAAYLSTAAAVFGRRVQQGIGGNVTSKDLIYSHVEKVWTGAQLERLHTGGFCTIRLRGSAPYNYVVSQGLTTLQRNTTVWNIDDATTCLVAQRDLADAVNAALQDELDGRQLGVEVTRDTLAAVLNAEADQLQRRGWLQQVPDAFAIQSLDLDATGNGWVGVWRVRLPVTTDFIGGTTQIIIGD